MVTKEQTIEELKRIQPMLRDCRINLGLVLRACMLVKKLRKQYEVSESEVIQILGGRRERTKGKVKRLNGRLCLSDIIVKYLISGATLRIWLRAGLPCERVHHTVIVEEVALQDWIRRRPQMGRQ